MVRPQAQSHRARTRAASAPASALILASASSSDAEAEADRYVVLAPLHSSMFGEILLCRDKQTQAEVVVKTVDLSLALQQESKEFGPVQENILQEIEVMTRIGAVGGHPNIIAMHGFFVTPKTNMLHVVLDYCEGGDLLEACSSNAGSFDGDAAVVTSPVASRVSETMALHYTRDVVAGLCFLHCNGIAHRDLSLENILLHDGRAVIADFGLCVMQENEPPRHRYSHQHQHRVMQCTEVVGKHYYMAPEVVAEQPYDPKKADVWSMGIVLFILLTSSPPFEIASAMDPSFRFMVVHGLRGILNAWGLATDVSESTQDLLDSMTAIDPDARPSVQEVLQHPAFERLSVVISENEAKTQLEAAAW